VLRASAGASICAGDSRTAFYRFGS